MENVMSVEWKDKYFDEKFKHLAEGNARVEKKVDENTKLTEKVKAQAEKTNGRVTKLEGDMAKIQGEVTGTPKAKDLPPWYRDPKYVQIFLYLSIAILLLVAAATRIDIRGVLP